jgi:hypothetical protein
MLEKDQGLDERISRRAHAVMKAGLIAGVQRLTDRAVHLGKPDAIKLLMEASGFHNPRVDHKHSGDINIKLTIPRPELPKQAGHAEVVDGTAIEE